MVRPEEGNRVERRRSLRLALKLQVAFAPAGQEGQATGSGMTENVSAGGLYFRTGDWQSLAEGDTLDLTVSGLSRYERGPMFRTLKGQATVLRLDAAAPPTDPGVAVCFSEPLQMESMFASA
jgi:hypothetical protein